LVVTAHEPKRETDLLGRFGRLAYRVVGATADAIIVHSDAALEVLTARCGAPSQKVHLMPHGVGTVSTGEPPRADYGLALGYVHPDKGLDVLVRAVAQLVEAGRNPALIVIAGAVRPRRGLFRVFEGRDRRYRRRLLQYVRGAGLENAIRFRGFVPSEQIRDVVGGADFLLLPYVNVTQSGVANLVLAHGRPAIASDLPGLRQDLGAAALYVPPSDAEALARAIDRLSKDPGLRSTLSAAARSRARERSLGVVAGLLIKTYGDVRGADPPHAATPPPIPGRRREVPGSPHLASRD
jgi:glycosyltransferase involved in cell wall biosynthesis